MVGHYKISKSERVHGSTHNTCDIITMDFRKKPMESSFYEHTVGKRTLAAVTERSSVVEQLAYIQRVGDSNPPVPISPCFFLK